MLRVGTYPLEGQRAIMGSEAPTRVVLADDHDVVRQGLKRLLDRAPEIEVVGEARNGLQALQSVEDLQPDVLLLDIEMPLMDGIEVARRLQEANFNVRILILSAYDDREYIRALLEIGVSGYLIKGDAPSKIIEAVRGVATGQDGWMSPQIRKKIEKLQDPVYKQEILNQRELNFLRLMAQGKSDAMIAEMLNLNSMECHRVIHALMKKLGVTSREDAVEIALREGWLNDQSNKS